MGRQLVIDTEIHDSVEKEEETSVTPNETFEETKDSIVHEVADNKESKQGQAQSRRLIEMNERSMVKPFQVYADEGKSGLLFPRSNCRDIMGLLQQENTEDLNLYFDWKRRDRVDFPTSSSKDQPLSPQPLPPISQAMRNRASKTENVFMAPNWTRVPVADIILR